MRAIQHEHYTEHIFSERFPYIGCLIGATEFPFVFFNSLQRKFAALQALSNIRFRPMVRVQEPANRGSYLDLIHVKTLERATVATESVADFMAALESLGELR